jgi:hypothetical protein
VAAGIVMLPARVLVAVVHPRSPGTTVADRAHAGRSDQQVVEQHRPRGDGRCARPVRHRRRRALRALQARHDACAGHDDGVDAEVRGRRRGDAAHQLPPADDDLDQQAARVRHPRRATRDEPRRRRAASVLEVQRREHALLPAGSRQTLRAGRSGRARRPGRAGRPRSAGRAIRASRTGWPRGSGRAGRARRADITLLRDERVVRGVDVGGRARRVRARHAVGRAVVADRLVQRVDRRRRPRAAMRAEPSGTRGAGRASRAGRTSRTGRSGDRGVSASWTCRAGRAGSSGRARWTSRPSRTGVAGVALVPLRAGRASGTGRTGRASRTGRTGRSGRASRTLSASRSGSASRASGTGSADVSGVSLRPWRTSVTLRAGCAGRSGSTSGTSRASSAGRASRSSRASVALRSGGTGRSDVAATAAAEQRPRLSGRLSARANVREVDRALVGHGAASGVVARGPLAFVAQRRTWIRHARWLAVVRGLEPGRPWRSAVAGVAHGSICSQSFGAPPPRSVGSVDPDVTVKVKRITPTPLTTKT